MRCDTDSRSGLAAVCGSNFFVTSVWGVRLRVSRLSVAFAPSEKRTLLCDDAARDVLAPVSGLDLVVVKVSGFGVRILSLKMWCCPPVMKSRCAVRAPRAAVLLPFWEQRSARAVDFKLFIADVTSVKSLRSSYMG